MRFAKGFLQSLEGCAGFDLDDFIQAHDLEPMVSVRLNQNKINHLSNIGSAFISDEDCILNESLISGRVPWSDGGLYLKTRPRFTLDPLLHAGVYYVQEASSMFIEFVLSSCLSNRKNLTALDLCASPGGKTTILASLPHFRLILANEIIQSRVGPLFENLVKWGAPHVFVSNNDPKDFSRIGEFFDVVLVDAPCSGSGLFRKDPSANDIWNKDLVDFCSLRQKRILRDAVSVVADSGYLLYSTCSYSFEENEKTLDYLIEEFGLESIPIDVSAEWGIVQSTSPDHNAFGYRFYPDKVKGEGFFCALLKKNSAIGRTAYPFSKGFQQSYKCNIEKWIEDQDRFHYTLQQDNLFAVDKSLVGDLKLFQQTLFLRKSGTKIGTLVRGELNPDHELAMSLIGSAEINKLELSYDEALTFLKKEKLEVDFPGKGWCLVTFKGFPLGLMKSMEGRSNNYYPKNWRITMRG